MSFIEFIKEKGPELKDGSLKSYNSILTGLYKTLFKDQPIDLSHLNNVEQMSEYADSRKSLSTRKQTYAVLFLMTGLRIYRDKMSDIWHKINEINSKQIRTEKQEENHVTQSELKELFDKLQIQAKMFYKIKEYNWSILQDYVLLSLYGGQFIPPRRSLDYTAMKIKNYNVDTDNYFLKNKFVFNNYKTAGIYGRQEIILPKPLLSIIKKWISINPTEWLLFDTNLNPMDSVKLNQKFNKLFGKNVSINQFRHSYLSEKYDSTIQVNREMAEDFYLMGSSSTQQTTYIQDSNSSLP
jgi:hypothetical protein